jgi:cellulose synthase/poly-beta-1,6-N-acetylglucosamine synthase-like glycosyltransferase
VLSIVVTAYKEEETIPSVIEYLLAPAQSGLGEHQLDKDWEFILIAPDHGTQEAARKALSALKIPASKFQILQDAGKGKPAALNQCFKVAKGDYLLLTDGDVVFKQGGIASLIEATEQAIAAEDNFGGITARPVGAAPKTTMLNYWGALLADAAHHKRQIDLTEHPVGFSTKLVKKREFFPLSGYGMLIKNIGWEIPEDTLVDDAFISYELHNNGYKLHYAPDAEVYVKYPTTLSDYFKQKKRSTGGYVQLWKYGVVKPGTKTRSFWRELEYFWFPIRYARGLRELVWSLMLYPTRLLLWAMIYWERKVLNKDFSKTWVRIESTK